MARSDFLRFLRYCVVGAAGFVTDAGVLLAVMHGFGIGPLMARIPSFTTAVLVTWYFNRSFTFRAHHRSFRESFPVYITANAVGLGVNVGTYTLLVTLAGMLPFLALAIGSVLGLAFNFFAARWIFMRPKA